VQLTVHTLTALVFDGRSGDLILNCLQNKTAKQILELGKLVIISQEKTCLMLRYEFAWRTFWDEKAD